MAGCAWQGCTPANTLLRGCAAFVCRGILCGLLLAVAVPFSACADTLHASDGSTGDGFGYSVSLSGGTALAGAAWDDGELGSAYLFQNLGGSGASITQDMKLAPSDGMSGEQFGVSVSLSGNIALVGSRLDNDNGSDAGSAYVLRNLDSTPVQTKLMASDGAADDWFGHSVSLSGSTALVGALFGDAAYLFLNVDTTEGPITENVKLTASDGVTGDVFGGSVSLSGSTALVGASGDDDRGSNSGSAYIFRLVDTLPVQIKLTASDGAANDRFGHSVSLSGGAALVGAYRDDDQGSDSGSAYVYRNLDAATEARADDVKLTASDGTDGDWFGYSVSLSGNTALVGAIGDDDHGSNSGSVYLFGNLDTTVGTVTESLKLTASQGVSNDRFGTSVSIDGDNFLVGAPGRDSSAGMVSFGSVSSLTTFDAGSASRVIYGISFVSRQHWIIGETTDNNTVRLSAGDAAEITAPDTAIHIGKLAGSNDNELTIAGTLSAKRIYIGQQGINSGNLLRLENTASFDIEEFYLSDWNTLAIAGDYTDAGAALAYLGGSELWAWDGGDWAAVDEGSFLNLVSADFTGGYTFLQTTSVPEPGRAMLLLAGLGAACLRRRCA